MKRTHGFSLLELVVTLAIVGILAAIAIPRFTDSETKATYFHEQVKAAIRYAQRQAVAQRRTVYVVVVDSDPDYIDLCYSATCTPANQRLTQIATGQQYTLTAPSGSVAISPPGTYSFNGLGQPNPSIGFSLSVGGKPITVAAETGYVQ